MPGLKEKIARAGVVGAGGAGFPSAFKLTDGIDTILINAVECEPLLKTDYYILKTYRQRLEQTIEKLLEMKLAKECVIAIKEHSAHTLGIQSGAFCSGGSYWVIDNIYPAGDELVLIADVLGRSVGSGQLPISQGVVVYNLETLYNIANAMEDIPVTHKFLTVGGASGRTYVVKTPIGTPLQVIVDGLGITLDDSMAVIDGGPMMGNIVGRDAVVTKTTKGYLILPETSKTVALKRMNRSTELKRASSACCGCRMCTDLCPRHLLGHDIEPHKIVKMVANGVTDARVYLGAFSCSSCGVCDKIACCQGLSPRSVFASVKTELVQAGIKPPKREITPLSQREYRRVPTGRIVRRMGLDKYDRNDFFFLEISPDSVTINVKQHIGKAYPVAVRVGDCVKRGDVLVTDDGGLGAVVHASIDGRISQITERAVSIDGSDRSH